ncbi:hypothetical protein CL620_00440 [archaeon]|nr:hypothetical protein [archaeon]|tara:strand:+ start:269 stop:1717 length:1449 start_codon:yes stop_codon:yes gene_type:complete
MKQLLTPLLVLVLLAVTVSANIEITDGLDNGDLLVEVDYSKFDEEDEERIIETTNAFTITNNGDAEEIITISAEGLPGDYRSANQEVTVAAGASTQVEFNIEAPHDKNPGRSSIGTIKLEASNTVTAPLVQNTLNMLSFKEITVDYVDEDGKNRDDDFDAQTETSFTLDNDVKPGTELILTFEVENLFDNDDYDESELEKIEIEIDADDDDIFPSDFTDTYDFSDIKADKKDEITVRFTIPEDANSGDYNLEFKLTGEDGKDVDYEIERKVKLELKREKDDVRFTQTRFSPATVQACEGNTYTLDLEIQNFGTDDQDHTVVTVENADLDISENFPDFALEEFDEDDTWRRSITYTVPAGLTAKTYNVDANVFIDRDETQDFKRIELVVEACPSAAPTPVVRPNRTPTQPTQSAETTEPAAGTDSNEEPEASTETNSVTGSAVVPQSIEDPYTIEDLFIGGIIVAVVLVVAMIGLFFMILIKK